jgi:hypothetical protein
MFVYHILGWLTLASAIGLSAAALWFGAGGWRRFAAPHFTPPPVPKLALLGPVIDDVPNPGFSDYVGVL